MFQDSCHVGRKVLFLPSDYTAMWVLAIIMKEKKVSSSMAKEKLKASTGTSFEHIAFNRKVSSCSTSN